MTCTEFLAMLDDLIDDTVTTAMRADLQEHLRGCEHCEVTLNTEGGFNLAAELKISVPGADKAKVQAAAEEAHTVCPYSKATKGNIPVKVTVV